MKGFTLKSASEMDYPPFAIVLPDGSPDGFSVDLLKAVTQATDLQVHFETGPWHEIKEKLAEGKLDILPLVSYSKERDKIFDFSAPYLRMHGTIFVRKNENSINGEDDLKDKYVLVMRSDTAHEYAVKEKLTKNLVLTDSFEEAMKRLSEGEKDAVVIQQVVGHQIIMKLGITNLIDVETFKTKSVKPARGPLSGFEQKFCFAVQEGNKELQAILNEGLAIVISNGTFDELYNKWFGPILPKAPVPLRTIIYSTLMIVGPILFLLAIAGVWYLKLDVKRKTITLSSEIEQRKHVEDKLMQAQDLLEQKVKKRTEELEKMYETQQTQVKLLAESNRELEDFVHVASHDLQEPLRKIQTFSDRIITLEKDNLDDRTFDYLTRMQLAVGRIRALVQSLLNYSLMTSNSPEFTWFNLRDPLEEAVSDLDIILKEKDGKVTCTPLPDINADQIQIRQLFQNLIANSLKYHGQEKPEITVTFIQPGSDKYYEILVEDNGIGFDNAYLEQIFKPFRRLHHKNSHYEGIGIGLSICRKIVESHGGTITAYSDPGKGATFSVKLPKTQIREVL